MTEPKRHRWSGPDMHYQEALVPAEGAEPDELGAEIIRGDQLWDIAASLREQLDEAVAFIRTITEELVNAGYPSGDRTVQLANLRALIKKKHY